MSEDTVQRLMGLADEFAEDAANDVQAFSTHASRKRLESALREALSAFPVELEQPEQPLGVSPQAGPGSLSLRSADPYRDLPTSERK